jgi:hypothetical protein
MQNEEFTLVPIKGGWAAVAHDWAVFGKTEDEAIAQFNVAKTRHEEILNRAAFEKNVLAPMRRTP